MRSHRAYIGLLVAPAIFAGLLFVTGAWAATQETILHSFRPSAIPPGLHAGTNDGYEPLYVNLIMDEAGNLYGTTAGGGIFGYGTVFKLTRTGDFWTEAVVYAFGHTQANGKGPVGGLIFDAAGNLYGTTRDGGDYNDGTVYELVHNADGTWTEKVLHSFNDTDGAGPYAPLIFDTAGNLYSTTQVGGAYNSGTAFELTPTGGGDWTEQVLHSFGYDTDGMYPTAPLVFDAGGNLYGTTGYGGEYQSGGTVFKLSPTMGGGWTEQVLHSFGSGVDGREPYAGGLIFDSFGNLYGTTAYGGINVCGEGSGNCGTVYELMPTGGGNWTEQVLYNFTDNFNDGHFPTSSLLFAAAGNLYGTTLYGGGRNNAGTVFKLTPAGGGWTEQLLYSFTGTNGDGTNPGGGLIPDGAGNLYGATFGGGAYDGGTVYEIAP